MLEYWKDTRKKKGNHTTHKIKRSALCEMGHAVNRLFARFSRPRRGARTLLLLLVSALLRLLGRPSASASLPELVARRSRPAIASPPFNHAPPFIDVSPQLSTHWSITQACWPIIIGLSSSLVDDVGLHTTTSEWRESGLGGQQANSKQQTTAAAPPLQAGRGAMAWGC